MMSSVQVLEGRRKKVGTEIKKAHSLERAFLVQFNSSPTPSACDGDGHNDGCNGDAGESGYGMCSEFSCGCLAVHTDIIWRR
jgi:hypothetical protein